MTHFWQITVAIFVCVEDVLLLTSSVYLLLSLTLNFYLLIHLATLPSAVGQDLNRLNKLGRVLGLMSCEEDFAERSLESGWALFPIYFFILY